MVCIRNGYLARESKKSSYRDWWMPKYTTSGCNCYINLNSIKLKKEYAGKKIRIKIEIKEMR